MKNYRRIMWITRKVFYPPDDGFKRVTWGTIKSFLEKGHKVSTIIFSPTEKYQDIFELCSKYKNLDISLYCYNPVFSIKTLFKSFFYSYPFNMLKHNTLNLLEKIKNKIKNEKPHYIILDSLHLSNWYKPLKNFFPDVKIFLREHNLEWEIMEGYFKFTNNLLYKLFLFTQYKKLKKYEIYKISEMDGVIFISERDKKEVEKIIGKRERFTSIGCGVDKIDVKYKVKRDYSKLCFIGRLDWYPNYEGLRWFIKRVFNVLCKQFPNIKLIIIGGGAFNSVIDSPNIEFKGKVKSIYPYLYSSGALIVPVFFGGGIRIKVIDALSTGIPIFSTNKGVEGLDLKKNNHYIECNTEYDFLKKLSDFIKNPKKYEEIGEAGKKFIQKNYSWDNIYEMWHSFFKKFSYEKNRV